jgi:hypothetical protein
MDVTKRETLINRMRLMAADGDVSAAHLEADNILLEALLEYGEHRLVDAWTKGAEKWLWR